MDSLNKPLRFFYKNPPPGCYPGKKCLECPVNDIDCIFAGKQTKEETEMLARCGLQQQACIDRQRDKALKLDRYAMKNITAETLRRLVNEGKTVRQISNELGASLTTVYKYLDLYGIEFRTKPSKKER